MNLLKTVVATLGVSSEDTKIDAEHIYDIKINAINGQPIELSQFKDKYILFVNVASKCGFTPQYKSLQKLFETYKDTLQVIGVPCNQFGSQEPGNSKDITEFCEMNYGVSFLITEKIIVKGKEQHPLYSWLTQKINNGVSNSSVKWNFQKYLIDKDGNLVDYFFSSTNPLSSKIIKHLK
ncbi:glutathione peroxidase [Hyunsoonleella pacifica]|uniref:Glutathione peroxidase n=1 Tax=Hyunsoonleella pacifica TaxID=1080224 RepID=A0A4Q9FSH8_9FLAO|nr:glutathione peroxidase [Hyunsoonleella pacifica]TBN19088.1 glutathione peroxidase [Hyunsoonleella pacifica]GGD07245.1 glutathione peroxidase [Hyunsoonleella pacifica]